MKTFAIVASLTLYTFAATAQLGRSDGVLQELLSAGAKPDSVAEDEFYFDLACNLIDEQPTKALKTFLVWADHYKSSQLMARAQYNIGWLQFKTGEDGACKATLTAILNASNDERESNTLMEPYALYKHRSCRILAELALRKKEFDEAEKYIEMFDKVYPYQHFCGNEWKAYDYYHDWMLARVYEGKGDFKKAIQILLPDVPDSGLASNNFIVEYLNGLLLREYSLAEIKAAVTAAVKKAKKKGKGDSEVEEIILFDTKMSFGTYGGSALRSDPFISKYL